MLRILNKFHNKFFFLLTLFCSHQINSDNFDLNIYNNHGVDGLKNTPTARTYDEGVNGITI